MQGGGTDCREDRGAVDTKPPTPKSFLPNSLHSCPVLPTDQLAPKAQSKHALLSTSHPCRPDSPPLTGGGRAEVQGASTSITKRKEPQILRSLSAPVTLKGKFAVAMVQSHSSLLIAALAQDSLSDKSVVCSAASTDRGWGQDRVAVELEKFTAKLSLYKLC